MRPLEGVGLALAQIRSQKLKSFFAVLGVVIGVMFLMIVVSVIEGMNRYMEDDFARKIYGLNTLTVRRTPSVSFETSETVWRSWFRRPRLTFEDAEAIRQRMTIPVRDAVSSSTTGRVRNGDGDDIERVPLTGGSADYFRIRDLGISEGRVFTPPEDRLEVPVVILGSETATNLFPGRDPIGRTVRINEFPFRVIGVLEEQGNLLGISVDNVAIAPARSAIGRMVNPHGIRSEERRVGKGSKRAAATEARKE